MKKAKSKTLSDVVRSHIQEGILSGSLFPGQRLKEKDLAAELNISRSPIREALKVLADDGLIVVTPWKGLSIAKLDRLQMLEIFVYREVLEEMAVEMACATISHERLEKLEELVGDHLFADDVTLSDLARNNQEFHRNIYEASENEYLLASVGALRALLALLPAENFRKPGRTRTIVDEHRQIVKSLRDRDPEAAKSAVREHIRNSAKAQMSLIIKDDLDIR